MNCHILLTKALYYIIRFGFITITYRIMKFDFKESRIISNGNIRPMRRRRRDDRAAVGWAWTGRNVILDEALSQSISQQ